MKNLIDQHRLQIEQELSDVGVVKHGSSRFAIKYLPNIILPEEHIVAAVFGRYSSGDGWLNWSTGMLIATDERIIFIDHKPGYTKMDEISYNIVAGIKVASAGPFSTIILHSRMGDYTIAYATQKSIDTFRKYIESRIETVGYQINLFGKSKNAVKM